ncbi:DegV family protein [Chloroflexota bacterium]
MFTLNHSEARTVALPRTISNEQKHMLKITEQKVVKGQPLHTITMHADALNKASILRDKIDSQFNCAELFITEFTLVMGAHISPGLIGVTFYSGDSS